MKQTKRQIAYHNNNHMKGIVKKKVLTMKSRKRIDRLFKIMWIVVLSAAAIALVMKYIVVTNEAYKTTGEAHNYIDSLEINRGNKYGN